PPPKKTQTQVTKVIKSTELVQPTKVAEDKPKQEEQQKDDGVEGGVEGGVAGGGVGGGGGGMAGAARPPPPPKPVVIQLSALKAQLVSGDLQIHLPKSVLTLVASQGVKEVKAMIKLCIAASGDVSSVEFMRRTGYAEADQNLESELRQLKFRPYLVNGQAVPTCAPDFVQDLLACWPDLAA